MAPFFVFTPLYGRYQETRMYLRKKATLIGVFGKSGCLFTETQIISPKKGNRKSGYREKGLLFSSNAPKNCGTHACGRQMQA